MGKHKKLSNRVDVCLSVYLFVNGQKMNIENSNNQLKYAAICVQLYIYNDVIIIIAIHVYI